MHALLTQRLVFRWQNINACYYLVFIVTNIYIQMNLNYCIDYVIPNDINPVTHGDDEKWEEDITDIGVVELNASLEAAENFEDFIQAEEQDQLHDSTTTNNSDGTDVLSQSYDCSEQDRFLESINWDKIL